MKKHPFALSFITGVASLVLIGCTGPSASSSVSGDSASSSATEATSSTGDACTDVDYVAKTHLSLEYEGKDFLTDGIARVNLKENVDGDTTHFFARNADGSSNTKVAIKSRYLCIDTPESTGQIQPWGKAASEFTASQILQAKTIVISSNAITYGAAKADSTGERYLSYVWISEQDNAPISSLRLLNLLIVQSGFSATKAATDSIYASAFYDADAQARCQKLYIWGNSSDSHFIYTTGVSTTLQEIVTGRKYDEDIGDYVDYDWTDSSHNKVAFDCYVAMTSGDNAYVYMDYPSYDDPTLSVRYGMYVFTGYRGIAPLTHVGWKLNVVGNCTTFNGNMQITNVSYNALYHDDDDISVLDKSGSTYTPLAINAKQAASSLYMNVVVKINDLHGVNDYHTYADSDNSAFTVHLKDASTTDITDYTQDVYLRFSYGVVTDRKDVTQTIGSTNFATYFTVSGETFSVTAPISRYVNSKNVTTYQLQLCHKADLVFNS
jgi:endonuclease YncB( thermonuclease family)